MSAKAKLKTLTQVARQSATDVQAELPRVLDRPTPFTVRSIGWKSATRATGYSVVFVRPLAAPYLAPLITGGTVRPKKRALLKPEGVPLNQYGNLPARKVRQLLARKDTFSGTVRGVGGIWQRLGQGRVKLLIAYQPEQKKRPVFPFPRMVATSARRDFPRLFAKNFDDAMRTAR